MNATQDALEIFNAAVAAVQPAPLLQQHLVVEKDNIYISKYIIPRHSFNNIYVIGAGKAAAAMAVATEQILGEFITDGLVTTKYHHALPCNKIKVIEGAHPVPDENCVAAVEATIQLLKKVAAGDVVICLISGGASALWCDVPETLSLAAIQSTFNQLITSGATIQEVNTVRKHLSSIKGGQLVKYCNGAKLFTLIISDVPGDDISSIASGPTVGDETTFMDAYAILLKYDLFHYLPDTVQAYINNGVNKLIADTPKPRDVIFQHTINTVIGNNAVAIKAAAKRAQELGYIVETNDILVTGDCEAAAEKLVMKAITYKGNKPVCFIQGGETTVKVTGSGKGGRNQHFVLTALYNLCKNESILQDNNIVVLSGGTDGTDGPTDAASAIAAINDCRLIKERNISIETYLRNHDAYHFFQQTNNLIITGATQTNVMDIMLTIVY